MKKGLIIGLIIVIIVCLILVFLIISWNSSKESDNSECIMEWENARNFCTQFSNNTCNNQTFELRPKYFVDCYWQDSLSFCNARPICE